MATKKYYCKWQGCRELLCYKGYCLKHKQAAERRSAEYQKNRMNSFKNAKRSNFYFYKSKEWKELRSAVLKTCPYCVRCGRSNDLHVDHITPPRGDKELFFNKNNLQVLCEQCHRQKTAGEIEARKSRDKNEVSKWVKKYVREK